MPGVYVGYHEHRFPEAPADKHREHVVRVGRELPSVLLVSEVIVRSARAVYDTHGFLLSHTSYKVSGDY